MARSWRDTWPNNGAINVKKKTTFKEWVRDLITNNPIATPGPTAAIELTNVSTGEIRIERIRLDRWEDADFRQGFADLRADEGLMPLQELVPPCPTAAELAVSA